MPPPPPTSQAQTAASTQPPNDPPPGAGVTHPNGALVSYGRSVYVFAGGRAFLVPRGALAKLRKIDHAVVVSAEAGAKAPTAEQPVAGTLLTTQYLTGDPTVYVVGNSGDLYGFASQQQLRAGGFDTALVVTAPSIGGLSVERESAGAAHIDAWTVRSNGAVVVSGHKDYVLAGGRAVDIPNAVALTALRKADRAIAVNGAVTAKDQLTAMANGTLVSLEGHGYAGVYVAFGSGMYVFRSVGQLARLGYGGTAAVPVPAADR